MSLKAAWGARARRGLVLSCRGESPDCRDGLPPPRVCGRALQGLLNFWRARFECDLTRRRPSTRLSGSQKEQQRFEAWGQLSPARSPELVWGSIEGRGTPMRWATPEVVSESRIADLDRYSPGRHDVLAERSAESTRYRIHHPFPPGPPTSVEAPAGPASSFSAKKKETANLDGGRDEPSQAAPATATVAGWERCAIHGPEYGPRTDGPRQAPRRVTRSGLPDR